MTCTDANKLEEEARKMPILTRNRNFGLSGIKTNMAADVRLGMVHSATNTRQLWNSKSPWVKLRYSRGMTSHARPDSGRNNMGVILIVVGVILISMGAIITVYKDE